MTDKHAVALQLGEMWLAGSAYLPQAGDHYAGLSRETGGTDNVDSAWDRYGTPQGSPISSTYPGAVYPVWEKVRDEFQRMLAQSATNLYDAGALVIRVAELFAGEDQDIAKDFALEKLRYADDPQFKVHDPGERQQPTKPLP